MDLWNLYVSFSSFSVIMVSANLGNTLKIWFLGWIGRGHNFCLQKSRMPLAGLVYLGPSRKGGGFLNLYTFRGLVLVLVLGLVLVLVVKIGKTVSADDSSLLIYGWVIPGSSITSYVRHSMTHHNWANYYHNHKGFPFNRAHVKTSPTQYGWCNTWPSYDNANQ